MFPFILRKKTQNVTTAKTLPNDYKNEIRTSICHYGRLCVDRETSLMLLFFIFYPCLGTFPLPSYQDPK